jgi:hypothetical protein
MRRRSIVALLATLMVMTMTLGASAAFAGEKTGNGDPTAAPDHGNSECLYSGLEDNDPGTGVVDPGVTQNWGHAKDAPVVVSAPRGASEVVLNFGGGEFTDGCNPHAVEEE